MPRHVQGSVCALPETEGEQGRDFLKPFIAANPFARDVLAKLDTEGYIVLPGVFSEEEADAALSRAWDFVETVSPGVSRKDSNSWWPRRQSDVDPWPYAQRDMMQLHQAGWVFSDLRERMAERVFERLYGTRELHSSKDGFTFQRPTSGDLGRSPNDHFDQGSLRLGLHCVQGSIALTDQEEADGCFQCWPGSHRFHEQIVSRRGAFAAESEFIMLKDKEKQLLERKGIRAIRVPVKRGDVILWRSDLCHNGAPPLGARENFRVVVYICCLPAVLTPEAVYAQKWRAYKQLETGSHWPNREEWFEPRRRNLDIQPFFKAPPELTLRQKELYGLVKYLTPDPSAPLPLAETVQEEVSRAEDSLDDSDPAQEGADFEGGPAGRKLPRRWGRKGS